MSELIARLDGYLDDLGRIVAILALALLGRWLLHRLIDRIVAAAVSRHTQRLRDLPGVSRLLSDSPGGAQARYAQRTQTMAAVLKSGVTMVVAAIAILTLLANFGVPLAPLLASAGVGGVALGFGAQSLVKDFLSGVFMIVEDQYGVGDLVDMDGVVGTVEDVSLRVTRLRDANGVIWYVRNGEVLKLGNRSQGWSTAAVDLPISLSENAVHAQEVVSAAVADLAEHEDVLEPPTVTIESLTGGAITLRVGVRCAPTKSLGITRLIVTRTKAALDREGISLASPAAGTTS